MFFKSDDINYSYKDIQTVLEKECSDICIEYKKPVQVKVLPNNKMNTNTNTNSKLYNIKVKPNLNNIKSQEWHHS
jgi:hypothetical protein